MLIGDMKTRASTMGYQAEKLNCHKKYKVNMEGYTDKYYCITGQTLLACSNIIFQLLPNLNNIDTYRRHI